MKLGILNVFDKFALIKSHSMKIQFLLFLAILTLSLGVHAQYANLDKKLKVFNAASEVCVILDEENPKLIATWQKKNETKAIENYREFIAVYNETLLSNIQKYWPYKQTVIGKTESELKKSGGSSVLVYILHHSLGKKVDQNYSGLTTNTNLNFEFYDYLPDVPEKVLSVYTEPDPSKNGVVSYKDYNSLIITLASDYYANTGMICEIGLTHQLPMETDIKFAMQFSKYFIDLLNVDPDPKSFDPQEIGNQEDLKNYTIAVNEKHVETDITRESLKSIFGLNMELMDEPSFDEIVLNGKQNYAYLMTSVSVPMHIGYPISVFVDAVTGEIIAMAYCNKSDRKIIADYMLENSVAVLSAKLLRLAASDLKE